MTQDESAVCELTNCVNPVDRQYGDEGEGRPGMREGHKRLRNRTGCRMPAHDEFRGPPGQRLFYRRELCGTPLTLVKSSHGTSLVLLL